MVGVAGLLVTLFAATVAPSAAQPTPDPDPGQGAALLADPGLTLGTNTIYYPWVANDDDFGLGPADTSITVQNLTARDTYIYLYKGTGDGWALHTTAYLAAWASKTFHAHELAIAAGTGVPVAVSAYRGGACVTALGPDGLLEAGRDVNGNLRCTDSEMLATLFDESVDEIDVCVVEASDGATAPYWDASTGTYRAWANVQELEARQLAGGQFGGLNNDGDCSDAEGGADAEPAIIGGVAKTAVDGESLPYTTVEDTAVSGYNALNGYELGAFEQWYLPIVQTNCGPGGCWDTVIRAANYDDANSALTLRFFPSDDGSGSLNSGFQLEFLINGGATESIVLSDYVPEGWVGSVHAYSDSAMMLLADRFKVGYTMWLTNTGSSADFEAETQQPGGLGRFVLYAPDVRIDYFGWNTGINVANLFAGDNTVTVQYFNLFGNATGTRTQRLSAHGMTYFYDPSQLPQDGSSQDPGSDLNADIIGSALIWSDYPVAVAVDATKYPESTSELDQQVFQGTSYSATANVYTWQAFPLVQKGNPATGMGATSGINMMNPNAVAAQALVYWVNQSGFGADNFGTSALAIPAFANGFVYTLAQHNLPNGFYGAAVVTSTYGIVATSANVDYQVQWDGSTIWNGFNPCGFYRGPGPELQQSELNCFLGDPFEQPEGGSVKKLFVDEFGEPIPDVWVEVFNRTAYERYVLGNEDYLGIPVILYGTSDINGEILWTNVPEGDYWLDVVEVPSAPSDVDDEELPQYVQILEAQGATLLGPWLETFTLLTGEDLTITNILENAEAVKIVETDLPATGPTDGAGGVYSGVYIFADLNCNAVLDRSDLGLTEGEVVDRGLFYSRALIARTVDADGRAVFSLGEDCYIAFADADGFTPVLDGFELERGEVEVNVLDAGPNSELTKHVCEEANSTDTACVLSGGNELQRIDPILPFPLISCVFSVTIPLPGIDFPQNTAFNMPCTITAEELEAALIAQIGPLLEGDIIVTGGPLQADQGMPTAPMFIEFTGQYAGENIPLITVAANGSGGGGETSTVREGGSGLQIPGATIRIWAALPFSEITEDGSADTLTWGENIVEDGQTDGLGVYTTILPAGRYILCAIGFEVGFDENCEFVELVESGTNVVNVLNPVDGPIPPPPPPVGDGTITKHVCNEINPSPDECAFFDGGLRNEIQQVEEIVNTSGGFINCEWMWEYAGEFSPTQSCATDGSNASVEAAIEALLVAAGNLGADVIVTGGPVLGTDGTFIRIEFAGSMAGIDVPDLITVIPGQSAAGGASAVIAEGGNQPAVNYALPGGTVQIWIAVQGTVLDDPGTYGPEVTSGPEPTDVNGVFVSTLLPSGRYVLCADAPNADGVCEFVDINDDDPEIVNDLNQPGTITAAFAGSEDTNLVNQTQQFLQYIDGVATGGTFTLTFCSPLTWVCEETADIPYNATNAQIVSSLEALSSIEPGEVIVGGGPMLAAPVTFTFAGQYAGISRMAFVQADDANLIFADDGVLIGPSQNVPAEATSSNERVSIFRIGAGATGGTFTLEFCPPGGGACEDTPPIPWNATAANVLTGLLALAAIQPGDVAVTQGPLPGTFIYVEFRGQYAGVNVPDLTIDNSGLTGGSGYFLGVDQQAVPLEFRQSLTANAFVSGGTFTLSWQGDTTAPIAWNATAQQIADALNTLPSITGGGGSVTAQGGPINLAPVIIGFTNVEDADTDLLIVDYSNLE